MTETSYYIEFDPSGRAKCKKCKEKINKGEIRIQQEVPGDRFSATYNFHPACFTMPRKLSTGANKITAIQFLEDIIEDKSGGEILPAKLEEIAEAIESKASSGKKSVDESDVPSPIDAIKAAYEQRSNDGDEPPKKKSKGEEVDPRAVDLYGELHKQKLDELKDYLRWNRQVLTGTKNMLLHKVIDGALRGRLARCQLCGGRLKIDDKNPSKTLCNGTFDETTQSRISCAYNGSLEEAPRWKWFDHEPSEEEKEAMDKLEEEAEGGGPKVSAADDDDVAKLKKAAEKLEWKLTSRDGLRAAAESMVSLLQDHKGKKVDIPEEQAKKKVGQIVVKNKEKSASEVVDIIVKEFGFTENKKALAEKKEESIKNVTKHPANAGLVAAFQELCELYFKEGNANAGASYKKVVTALTDLDFEITEDNAKGLAKGKTKVPNIGKSSADKIHEFVTTGTIKKLEEKRADAA